MTSAGAGHASLAQTCRQTNIHTHEKIKPDTVLVNLYNFEASPVDTVGFS